MVVHGRSEPGSTGPGRQPSTGPGHQSMNVRAAAVARRVRSECGQWAPPGWYPDPHSPVHVRYWDGTAWTPHTAPAVPSSPAVYAWPGPPVSQPVPARLAVGWLIGAVAAFVAVVLAVVVAAALGGVSGHQSTATMPPLTGVTLPADRVYHPPLGPDGVPALVTFGPPAVEIDPPRASVPPALYAVPPGSDVVTRASAQDVALAIWTMRRSAITAQSRATLARFETGSALAVDAARGCGCGNPDRFGPADSVTVAVGHSSAFPAHFFAKVSTTLNDTPWSALLVFTRAAPDKPWRLAFAGGGQPLAGGNSTFPFSIGDDGYVSSVPPPVAARGARLAPALADLWQAAKVGAKPVGAPDWATGTLTDQWVREISQNRQGKVNRGNGLTGYYRYAATPHAATYVVPLLGDEYLACAPILGEGTFLSTNGREVYQSTDRLNWGTELAPGTYRAVTTIDEYTPCFAFTATGNTVAVNGVTPPDTVAVVGVP